MAKAFEELQIRDDISPELMRVLDYIDGQEPTDDYTRNLDDEVW